MRCKCGYKITEWNITMILSGNKFISLKACGQKYRSKHETFNGFLSDELWERISMIPWMASVDNKTKDLQYKTLMRFFSN